MEKWDYTTMTVETTGMMGGKLDVPDFEEQLSRYGADGWELVSCFTTNKGYGETRNVVCVFKRKKGTV